MEENCNGCRFWIQGHSGFGYCHRNAPQATAVQRFSEDADLETGSVVWPIVTFDEWCGEWENNWENNKGK